MAGDLIDLIKTLPIFKSLNEEGYNKISHQLDKIKLQPGDVLFYQGDPSDFVYILASGKLATSLLTTNNEYKHISTIATVEIIGELGVLSGQPRSLTVKAITHAELLRVPNQTFKELCEQYPSILLEIIKPIISRSQKTIQLIAGQNKCKYVVIFPANQSIDINQFKEKLKKYTEQQKDIALLEDTQINLDNATEYFSVLEKKCHVIIILHTTQNFSEKQIWLEKANSIYVLANASSEPKIDHAVVEVLHSKYLPNAKHELILLHPNKTKQPENTNQWLTKGNFIFKHHIRIDNNKDYERLMRFINGTATGLVLSGAGIKGWGHIGVIKAIQEKDIIIDVIGGTSVGAVIGACYDISQNYEDTFNMFYAIAKMANLTFSIRKFTWPLLSVLSVNSATTALQEAFDNIQIEDLWIPFFCVSSNLSEKKEEAHFSGCLWEKLRASASLPGIAPPMVINGQLHYDGSLLNSLPVDHMRNLLGPKAKIIASAVSHEKDEIKYNFPPFMSFMQAFLKQMKLGYKSYVVPPFFETFVSAMLLGSAHKEKQTILLADYMIEVHVPTKASLLSLKKIHRRKLVDIGYKAARKIL